MVYLPSETLAEVSFYHFKENVFRFQCLCLFVYFLDLFQYIPSKSPPHGEANYLFLQAEILSILDSWHCQISIVYMLKRIT